MRDFVVEDTFEQNGFMCVVVQQSLGHRCGYVGLPKGHSLYGMDMNNEEVWEINCHGGVTFAENGKKYPIETTEDYWWIGWDYGHWGDGVDYKSYLKNFGREAFDMMIKMHTYSAIGGYPYSLDEVREECISVANQIAERG